MQVSLAGQVDELEQPPRLLVGLFFFLAGGGQAGHDAEKSGLQVTVQPDQDVFHGREVGKEADVLIGAGDPPPHDLVGQQAHQGMVIQKDLPFSGR